MPRPRSEDLPALPPLWAGVRRRQLTLLVCAGLGHAVVTGLAAHFVLHSLSGGNSVSKGPLFALLLVGAAVAAGVLQRAERVVSEQLSQSYVHQLRLGMIRRHLSDGNVRSLGVAVARTTNDLSSIKSWITQGVAPLAVDIPLVVGAGAVLLLLDPVLGLALLLPTAVFLTGLCLLSPIAYERARALRRIRGRLAGRIADTILSSTAIRSAGGTRRELKRVDRFSSMLVEAAVHRARAGGALRGLATTTSGLALASIVGTATIIGLPAPHLAAALTVAGFLARPVHDIGRVAEYRQTYRAARRIIGPSVQEPPAGNGPERVTAGSRVDTEEDACVAQVVASGMSSNGTSMEKLTADPGDRVVLDIGNKQLTTELLDQFVGLSPVRSGEITIDGTDLRYADHAIRRRLVGYGTQGMTLSRATITRTVCYRGARASASQSTELLGLVGLAERVNELPRGENTMLSQGGEPLTIPERARLILARAMFNQPPVLVFDHLDSDLGREGRATMRQLLLDYPGVVIVASDDPQEIITPTLVWRPQGVPKDRHSGGHQ